MCGEVDVHTATLGVVLAGHPVPEHAGGDGEGVRLALHALVKLRDGVQSAAEWSLQK